MTRVKVSPPYCLPNHLSAFMLQHMSEANHLESPCIQLCAVSARAGFCIGCGRKLAEIAGWGGFDALQKQAILDALPNRLANLEQANLEQTG